MDKAIVLACCLAVVGCELSGAGTVEASLQEDYAHALPFAVAMLAAACCALLREASARPGVLAAHAAYCLVACAVPPAAAFTPLIAYDCARCLHAPNALRALSALSVVPFLACAATHGLGTLALGALGCVLAASIALSVRTNRALARQAIAHLTRDTMESQAIALKQRNKRLETAVAALGEKRAEADAAASPEGSQPQTAASGGAQQATGDPARPAAFACLTEREYEVARLVAEGLDNRDIASTAYLSEGTVRNNISSILSKMGLKNRTQIAVAFYKGAR